MQMRISVFPCGSIIPHIGISKKKLRALVIPLTSRRFTIRNVEGKKF